MLSCMAGGMKRGDGPTLAERVAPGAVSTPPMSQRRADVTQRHCWVRGLPEAPGQWPGLLVEWRTGADDTPSTETPSGWEGRVVYAVDEAPGRVVLVEAWVDARHLRPA